MSDKLRFYVRNIEIKMRIKNFLLKKLNFFKDLKLSREISHLSLLWFKPENRNFQNIYDKIKTRCRKFKKKK